MMFSRYALVSFAVLTTVLVSFSPYSVCASDAVDVSTSFVQQRESLDEQDKTEFVGHAVSRGSEGGEDK